MDLLLSLLYVIMETCARAMGDYGVLDLLSHSSKDFPVATDRRNARIEAGWEPPPPYGQAWEVGR
jgi:hypothetical protein